MYTYTLSDKIQEVQEKLEMISDENEQQKNNADSTQIQTVRQEGCWMLKKTKLKKGRQNRYLTLSMK